jgi:hemoglobin
MKNRQQLARAFRKMYRFWQTILLKSYSGSPFPPHKHLPVDKSHFDRWMEILLQQ